jgi:hypothetical protein
VWVAMQEWHGTGRRRRCINEAMSPSGKVPTPSIGGAAAKPGKWWSIEGSAQQMTGQDISRPS